MLGHEKMKTTQYFRYTRERPDRVMILDEWIERTIQNPLRRKCKVMDEFAFGQELSNWKIGF